MSGMNRGGDGGGGGRGGGRIYNDRNGGGRGGRGGAGGAGGERGGRQHMPSFGGMPLDGPEMEEDFDPEANDLEYDPTAVAKKRLSKGGYGYDQIEGLALAGRPRGKKRAASLELFVPVPPTVRHIYNRIQT